MTYDSNSERRAVEALDKAREHYEQFQEALAELGREMRPIDNHEWERFDAYPGWTGNRDVGAGMSMMDWLEEVAQRLGVSEQDQPDYR